MPPGPPMGIPSPSSGRIPSTPGFTPSRRVGGAENPTSPGCRRGTGVVARWQQTGRHSGGLRQEQQLDTMSRGPDGSNPVQVSPGANFTIQAGKRTGGDNWPSWSPDGRRIVYASDWGGGFEMVYVAMADGQQCRFSRQPLGLGSHRLPARLGAGRLHSPGNLGAVERLSDRWRKRSRPAIHIYDSETAQDYYCSAGRRSATGRACGPTGWSTRN